MTSPKATPMIRQYLAIKAQYPDAILFYRMGDFYEMFFEDAKVASRVLEIALTTRNKKDANPVPMCGVPHRAAESYIARLIDHGHKVAVCDQVEDPALAKGLVKREVVQVITPGMIVDKAYLDDKSNNYVLSLVIDADSIGIAYLDISTATFRTSESTDTKVIAEEVLRVDPKEILLPQSSRPDSHYDDLLQRLNGQYFTFIEDAAFDFKRGRERLLEQFKTRSLEGFGLEGARSSVRSAGALLYYVQETQKQEVAHLSTIEPYRFDQHLWLDDLSCRNLELLKNLRGGGRQGTLLSVLDRTVTAMGARKFKQWLRYPLLRSDHIAMRLDAVDEAKHDIQARSHIRECLKEVYDLERLISRIVMGHANARDLVALKHSLQQLPKLWQALANFKAALYTFEIDAAALTDIAQQIEEAIRENAPPTISEGGIIKSGYSAELDELIQIGQDGKGWLAKLEIDEKAQTGIGSLKVRYNKVFGYYIEVPKSQTASVPTHYVRKQTLVNAERYITDELKQFEMKVMGAQEKRAALEYDLFNEIRRHIVQQQSAILSVADLLAQLDCLLNLAEVADHQNYTRPNLTENGRYRIEDGRHPVVEQMIVAERFVPNSLHMDNESQQVLIITGPNMAGKSTVLRQTALLVLMAHMGSFVPARQADISLTDRIFTRVGALDNLSQGQSTFMVEMEETANIINNATPRSLVIMDEIGRGTSTFDGLSIAWAVAEYLHDLQGKGVKTLFATHYHELTDLALTKPRVKNYNIAVKEWNDEIIFLRKLVEGGTNRSYGIQVARLAGLPGKVIQRAKMVLANIEKGEHGLDGLPLIARGEPAQPRGHVQLNLFRTPEHILIERLKKMDVLNLTPLEALNYLSDLQERAKALN